MKGGQKSDVQTCFFWSAQHFLFCFVLTSIRYQQVISYKKNIFWLSWTNKIWPYLRYISYDYSDWSFKSLAPLDKTYALQYATVPTTPYCLRPHCSLFVAHCPLQPSKILIHTLKASPGCLQNINTG